MLRTYEMMTILAPDVQEDELGPALDTIAKYIATAGGTLTYLSRESPWGRRRLAYNVRYQSRDVRDGFYTLWQFTAEPEAILEIDRDLRLFDRLMRHMITVATSVLTYPEPAAEPAPAPAAPAAEAAEAPVVEASAPDAEPVADEPAADAPTSEE